jgi:hypothetical protein
MTSAFRLRTLDQLTIEDEPAFQHVALYADLKAILLRDRYGFRVMPEGEGRWDRALLLNLTFWGADGGGDVLVDDEIPADVVAHVAWHHLAARALNQTPGAPQTADALLLGEAIASAFDVYLVGKLLGRVQSSSFMETQVGEMSDAAEQAGLEEEGFAELLSVIATDPERSFEDLRALLVDAGRALLACKDASEAFLALQRFDAHPFAPLLHRYELSNWTLYARAYARDGVVVDDVARGVDATLRAQESSLEWLTRHWVLPALERRS